VFTVVRDYHRPFEIKGFYIERTVYFTRRPINTCTRPGPYRQDV